VNADSPVTITVFRSFGATSQTRMAYSLGSLAETIQRRNAPTKDALPWLKLAMFGNVRTAKNSLRHDANVLSITGIEADYDAGKMTFDEAHEVLEKQGLASLLYTSPSHTDDAPRWRVLCPLAVELPRARRDHLMGRLNGLFRGIFAGESWTLSQSYYFGSVASNPSHIVEIIEGQTIDEHDDLDVVAIGKPASAAGADTSAGKVGQDGRDDAELIRGIVSGEHLHVELVALAARYVARGIPGRTICGLLQGLMLSHPPASRDARWQDRFDDIGRTVASARSKFKGNAEAHRKAVARLALSLVRRRQPDNEIRWHVFRAAEAIGLTIEDADAIITWARRAIAEDGHAA